MMKVPTLEADVDRRTEAADRCGWMRTISIYNPYVQPFVRLIGMMLQGMILAIMLAIGISLVLQACFEAFATDYGLDVIYFVHICLLPWLGIITSIFCSECVSLCLDIVDRPPLPVFFSLLSFMLGSSTFSSRALIINRFIVGSLFFCIIAWIFRLHLLGLMWAACLLIVSIVAKIYVFSSEARRRLWLLHRNAFLEIQKEEDLEQQLAGIKAVHSDEDDDGVLVANQDERRAGGILCSPRLHVIIFAGMQIILMLSLQIGVKYLEWIHGDSPAWDAAAFAILFGLIVSIHRTLPMGFANHFLVFTCVLLLLAILLFTSDYHALIGGEREGYQSFFTTREDVPSSFNPLFILPQEAIYSPRAGAYPLCSMRWGNVSDEAKRLSVMDMLVFADATYADDATHACELVENVTRGTHIGHHTDWDRFDLVWSGMQCGSTILFRDNNFGRPFLFKMPLAKVCVLAFRGTHTVTDVLADAYMWSTIKGIQVFDDFVPLLNILPRALVEKLVLLADWRVWFGEPMPWDQRVEYAREEKRQCELDGYELVLTGHSLGGGLAQIIAARLGVQAIVFSPVGTGFSSEHFGITRQAVMENVVSVVPIRDPIPQIDVQEGFVQPIDCTAASDMECHSLRLAGRELFKKCGDPRARVPRE